MEHDEGYWRFFAYLNLFVAMMLTLVLADNLVLLFVGWEGVGLCSYLLIGFWYTDTEKAWAGRKAFIVNRIGDFAFILGDDLPRPHARRRPRRWGERRRSDGRTSPTSAARGPG